MRALIRRNPVWFAAFTAAAFVLRAFFLWRFGFVAGDSFIYGDIAKNWMSDGAYAMTEGARLVPTLIRLPGYPALLVAVWSVFGVEHYTAVMVVQMFIDVATCFVTAALALETAGERAARMAFAISAGCIFYANYVATPMAEVPAIFFAALTLLAAAKGLHGLRDGRLSPWWAACGLGIGISTLLRPDGGILLPAIGLYLLLWMIVMGGAGRVLLAGILVAVFALGPLVPWALRNQRTFGIFQPLAPRFANNPGEFAPRGFYRWVRTWMVDYISVEDIYWHVPGEEVDPTLLPPRAFDDEIQRAWTFALFNVYNQDYQMTPELDAQFRSLAEQRVQASLLRYYVLLPSARVLDMWLRPRTEALPLNSRWWELASDPRDSLIGIALGAINLALIGLALLGAFRGDVRPAGFMLVWIVLRCLFLGTLENPEPRYVLECYPAVIVFASAALARLRRA